MSESLVQLSRCFTDLRGKLEAMKRQMLMRLRSGETQSVIYAIRCRSKALLRGRTLQSRLLTQHFCQ